jgi:hypothetical protein
VGEILDGAFGLIRRHPRPVLGLSLIASAGLELVRFLLYLSTRNSDAGLAVGGYLGSVLHGCVVVFLAGVLAPIIGESMLDRPAGVPTVRERLRGRWGALVLVALVAGAGPWFGLVGVIVGGLFLWGAFAFAAPALVMEQRSVPAAVRRSFQLSVPAWFRVFLIAGLGWLISYVVRLVISIPYFVVVSATLVRSLDGGGARHLSLGVEIVERLTGLVAETIAMPFVAGVFVLLYIDRRMRVEALDIALRQAVEPSPS